MIKTINWAAPVDGDFADGADWVGASEPTKKEIANLQAVDGSAYTVTFDTPLMGNKATAVGGLEVGAGVTLDVDDPLFVGGVVHGAESYANVTNGGTINLNSGFTFENLFRVTGTFTNQGLLSVQGSCEIYLFTSQSKIVNTGRIVMADGFITRDGIDGGFQNSGVVSGLGGIWELTTNTGTISGGVALLLPTVNDGLLEADVPGETLIAKASVTGTGSVLIDGGTFEINQSQFGGDTFAQNVTFGASASSTFALGSIDRSGHEAPEIYTGTISGFSRKGNSSIELLDMVGAGPASATYSGTKTGGVLTVTGDGHSETLTFAGGYLNTTFTAAMTSSGTIIRASANGDKAPPSIGGMAQAMASFAGAAPHGALQPSRPVAGHFDSLVAPGRQ